MWYKDQESFFEHSKDRSVPKNKNKTELTWVVDNFNHMHRRGPSGLTQNLGELSGKFNYVY